MKYLKTYEEGFLKSTKVWDDANITLMDLKIMEFYIKNKFKLVDEMLFKRVYIQEFAEPRSRKIEIKIYFHKGYSKEKVKKIFEKIKIYLRPERYLLDDDGIDNAFYYIISLERFLEIREEIELEKNMRKYNL